MSIVNEAQFNYIQKLPNFNLSDILKSKNTWRKVKLHDIAFETTIRVTEKNKNNFKIFIGSEHLDNWSFKITRHGNPKDVISDMKEFKENDILLVRRSLYASDFKERASIANFNGICSGDIFVINEKEGKVDKLFLLCILNSVKIWKYIVANASGSFTRRIKWQELSSFECSLPPAIMQRTIGLLLWDLEIQLDLTYKIENNLKSLKKALLTKVFTENTEGVVKVKFEEVALHSTVSESKPLDKGIDRYVGLEHLESENLVLSTFGDLEKDKVTFTKLFKAGDILFGRRRAYLKKAAIADFDGICSSDILVFHPKLENINSHFFPYIIQNDAFFDFAVSASAGSLSPRVSWSELKDYTFYLPSSQKQAELAQLFKSFDARIQEIKKVRVDLQALKKGLINEIIN